MFIFRLSESGIGSDPTVKILRVAPSLFKANSIVQKKLKEKKREHATGL